MTTNKPKKIVIVLANLMDANGVLNEETRGRLELGCRVAQDIKASEVVFMGWDYRNDCNLPISVAMKIEAEQRGLCPDIPLRCNLLSRDTVGDAVFSAADYWPDFAHVLPVVTTSDYHVTRTQQVFEAVWGKDITVHGAKTPDPAKRHESELASIKAFKNTFNGVSAGDLKGYVSRMRTEHPFYNGVALGERPFDWSKLAPALVACQPD
ncbi:ElyC/SanA/YdcF family protein [Thioclava sp. A2]|uniref:ElyC/SanA/YdcF family protein n=1 Tax=Thioclava sp. FCG-A2 TaxID=3080562 RepID=UPI00295469A9|nr:ElyC/SanA/YdcF family protein [Thioclava sp. A2]MDV7270358.1 ElyC/SanA/YdcF family protein [Thioclava sp. A2]